MGARTIVRNRRLCRSRTAVTSPWSNWITRENRRRRTTWASKTVRAKRTRASSAQTMRSDRFSSSSIESAAFVRLTTITLLNLSFFLTDKPDTWRKTSGNKLNLHRPYYHILDWYPLDFNHSTTSYNCERYSPTQKRSGTIHTNYQLMAATRTTEVAEASLRSNIRILHSVPGSIPGSTKAARPKCPYTSLLCSAHLEFEQRFHQIAHQCRMERESLELHWFQEQFHSTVRRFTRFCVAQRCIICLNRHPTREPFWCPHELLYQVQPFNTDLLAMKISYSKHRNEH